ncbi:MAG: carbohydrate-binding protein, partial [Bacteroidales bacterium]|nr:carbohydrate-binding protein [Bacteroidales bacterium]
MMKKTTIGLLLIIAIVKGVSAQEYLHVEGKEIVDGNGENFIIRSIGTGNWMLMEGYMMQTSGAAGTQHEFRERLNDIIGEDSTDIFFESWLDNHFTKRDVDSLAAWGFNTIRPALHYKWFTLPIEEEPVAGIQTWLEKGFALSDSLVKWCSENEMYVIFEMHGAPGGQGANADISDYDPSKPSLWESEENKTKLVALWHEIAKRYSDEPWVGGYDLINETNWTFPEGNNSQMKTLFLRLTDTIRMVDTNHILFIEGNSWANDYSGLTPPWDDNMAYSFHKYWSYNNENSLDWVINDIRNKYNVPIWLGESGENSNTWYTNLISLCERKNVGWSWWPVKKVAVNNPLRVNKNEDYSDLVEYWKGNASKPSKDEAFSAVMTFAENHNIENCTVQRDVIDAMFRQAHSTETLPYLSVHHPEDIVFASNYDLGRNGYSYFDNDTANYSLETDYTAWNNGWAYRSDGVDIEGCTDSDTTNGYNVGWIGDGEWMVYSMHCDTAVLADGIIRSAGQSGTAKLVFEVDGKVISQTIELTASGGWQSWKSTAFSDVLLPAGDIKLKIKFIEGGVNLNYFQFSNFRSPDEVKFDAIIGETSELGNEILLHMNKEFALNQAKPEDFILFNGTDTISIDSLALDASSVYILQLFPSEILPYTAKLLLNYDGRSISSGDELLSQISGMSITNNLKTYYTVPAKIQAEDFITNNGFALEDCSDTGGGENTGYANSGDYLDYLIYVPEAQEYDIILRVALNNGTASVKFLYEEEDGSFADLSSMILYVTGGWQTWESQESRISLPQGKYLFRIRAQSGEHNLNWFEFIALPDTIPPTNTEPAFDQKLEVYPNPVRDQLFVRLPKNSNSSIMEEFTLNVYDNTGRLV